MGYREASIMMTKAQEPMTDLDALLMKAREADPGDRIDLRDEIAAHGEAAIEAMNDWLGDPRLAAFAIRVLERAGQSPTHRPAVLEVLDAIDRDELPPHLQSDLNRALGSLGVAVPLPTAGGRGRRQSPARRPIGTRDHDHRAPSALEGRARARVDEPEDRAASIRRGRQEWTLWWPDRNNRWEQYSDIDPARDVGPLLREIDEDPTALPPRPVRRSTSPRDVPFQ